MSTAGRERLREPRTEAGKRLLAREEYNARSFTLIMAEDIIAIEEEAAALAHDRPSGSDEWLRDLRAAVELMDTKVTPYGEREDGTTSAYIVADSTWHRVVAIARGATSENARAALSGSSDPEAVVLPDDMVCACLDETGERKVRLYERCQRCGAFMASDPEAVGLDVERLQAAILEVGDVAEYKLGWSREYAERIAAEYARLTEAKPETPAPEEKT
jgi:hypothetical protein